MWGGLFGLDTAEQRETANAVLARHCSNAGVWPYIVPAGGFMVSPPYNTGEVELREAGRRLGCAVKATAEELQGVGGGWGGVR